jgi:FKBP-type peptidyl-prolyl cis-trans isomerase
MTRLISLLITAVMIALSVSTGLLSCGNREEAPAEKELNPKALEKPLINANKQAVKTEEEQINNYISRHNWKMQETGSGLLYGIYKIGNGEKAQTGKLATVSYTVKLITGEEIYSSTQSGPKTFLIGRGGVESGLEEGILLLRVGDHAKLIIPSHLGYGLLGDQDKVPPKSTLIYDIELLDLK